MQKFFFETLLKGAARRWSESGWTVRGLILLAALVLLFVFARVGALGTEAERFARISVPVALPVVDSIPASGTLMARVEIAEGGGWKELIAGDACPSGSRLRFTVTPGQAGWLTGFGLSGGARYAVREEGFEPISVDMGTPIASTLVLDDEKGIEIFGFVLSVTPISADVIEEIALDHDAAIAALDAAKGGSVPSAFGALPDGIVATSTFCRHTD